MNEFIDRYECAAILQITPRHFSESWVHDPKKKLPPYVQAGRKRLWNRAELLEWLARQVKP